MARSLINKVGSISLSILEYLAFAAEGMVSAVLNPYEARKMIKNDNFQSQKLFDYLRGLDRSGYIKLEPREKGYSVVITGKGKLKLLETAPINFDGKWRMLSFDIPEDRRVDRDGFRRTIKRIGFLQVQKSLWACPYIKADEVELAISEYDLSEFVAYMVVEKTDINIHLKKLFGL